MKKKKLTKKLARTAGKSTIQSIHFNENIFIRITTKNTTTLIQLKFWNFIEASLTLVWIYIRWILFMQMNAQLRTARQILIYGSNE